MNKSLDSLAIGDNKELVSLMPIDVYMPYPMHALLINCQPGAEHKLEHHLAHACNFTWVTTDRLAKASGHQHSYNLLLLVLPNDEADAVDALQCAASYGIDIILLGHNTPQGVLRLAFQQGVCDFIDYQAPSIELLEAIKHVAARFEQESGLAPVLAVLNGKGGSGASFIATSIASIAAQQEKFQVALIDSDLHYGTLAHMLGVKPSYFITDALESLEQLDGLALTSAMTSKEQLHLLAARPFSLINGGEEIKPDQFKQLLWKCRQHYNQVVIDLSRGPEMWNSSALDDADILLVLQQNVMSIRETKALIEQLIIQMGISKQRIHLLINRYQNSGVDVSLNDIKETTGIDSIWVIANDFKVASQCTDLSEVISNIAKRRRILKDLKKITSHFSAQSPEALAASSGFWSRLFGRT